MIMIFLPIKNKQPVRKITHFSQCYLAYFVVLFIYNHDGSLPLNFVILQNLGVYDHLNMNQKYC